MVDQFIESISKGYSLKGDYIILGAAMFNGEAHDAAQIRLPLKMFNRHGLIAGATGTGKTKTLQLIAEKLSEKGVPSFVMDIKGDLSGVAVAGTNNPKIEERYQKLGLAWEAHGNPIEFLSISNEPGVKLKATLLEMGPVLFSRMLDLNDTQAGIVSLIFKYCDDKNLPLLNLEDFKTTVNFLSNEGKNELKENYGSIPTSSTGIILRKIIELEQQGAEVFFGEPSFDVMDLLRTDGNGKGYINIFRLTDLQSKPKLFSTFLLSLLAELYEILPEEGDIEKPKLCFFIDESHLIFNGASKALLEQIETIIKLIRSKGVGVFFITQNPQDIPAPVLSQLGLKVQHALRAFTAKDRRDIKQTAENYPTSNFYTTDEVLTSLGIGEALVTGLNEKGIPMPLAATLLCTPASRMDILTNEEINAIVKQSKIAPFYNRALDSESAHEILKKKIKAEAKEVEADEKIPTQPTSRRAEKSTFEKALSNPTTRSLANTVIREVTRGLMGILGLNSTRRSRR